MDSKSGVKSDAERLHELGYAQELARHMSAFSNFAVSFRLHPAAARLAEHLRRPPDRAAERHQRLVAPAWLAACPASTCRRT